MWEVIVVNAVQLARALLIAAIAVTGTWLAVKCGKRMGLKNTGLALEALADAAETTVDELKQTLVDDLKAAHADGKLTQDEILSLKEKLLTMTIEKLSTAAQNVLNAAGVDITSYITGHAEAYIGKSKTSK